MDLLELIIEYHRDNERQGPGSEDASTDFSEGSGKG